MSAPSKYNHHATLCAEKNRSCPKVFVSDDADELKQVMITDDCGGKIYISHEQLELLKTTNV